MSRKSPEQLEAEADELMKQHGLVPEEPETPETEQATEVAGKATEAEAKPEGEAEAAAETSSTEAAPEPEKTGTDTAAETPPDELVELKTQLAVAEERYKHAQANMTRATQEASRLKKQNAELQSQIDSVGARLGQLEEKDRSATAAAETARSAQAQQQIDKLAEEYPDLAPLFEQNKALTAANRTLTDKLNALEGKVTTKPAPAAAEATDSGDPEAEAYEAHIAAIAAVHPDWQKITSGKPFQDWIAQQPPVVQQVTQTGTADDVNMLLRAFNEAVRKKQLADALATTTPPTPTTRKPVTNKTGKPTFTRDQIKKMPREEFVRREAEIDAAMAEGRVY